MVAEPLRRSSSEPDVVFVRCSQCGRRVSSWRRVCSMHGPLSAPDSEVTLTAATGIDLQRFPGYRTRSVLGRGGFGTVFAAEPLGGGPLAAIKLARSDRPDAGARLLHEIAVLKDIGPPHVPRVLGSGKLDSGSPYAVIEFIEAPTLASRLTEPVGLGEALDIAEAILRTLRVVHERGWAHRDLKPENLFVDDAGHVTIVDFGLVRRETATPEDDEGVGTADYMAPEQCDGQGEVDTRADVYAMGILLYELLAGAPPFWGPAAVVRQCQVSSRPPRLSLVAGSFIPRAIEEVVHRCISKDRHDRYADAGALLEALAQARGTAASKPPSVKAPVPKGADVAVAPRGDRRTVCLLFFETLADVPVLQKRLASLGGQLVHAARCRRVVLYGHDMADNPARLAYRAALELLRDRLCERIRIDVGPVSIQTRADGSKRFLSPAFMRADRFPSPTDPLGVILTPAAEAVLSGATPPPNVTSTGISFFPPPGEAPPREESQEDTPTDLLIGRDTTLELLLESARSAIQDPAPTLVSVVGETGHGKSRLFNALGKRLRRLEVPGEVLDLRAGEPTRDGGDTTVRLLLQRLSDLPATAPPDGGAELLRERLGDPEAVPAVALSLGWVTAGSPLESGLRSLGVAPFALRSALTRVVGEALRRRASQGPLMVLLDDAHHADEATLAAFEYATLAEARAPLWICTLGRPSFTEEHPTWGERAGRHESMVLGPLDRTSAAELCRRLLRPVEDIPDSVVDRLIERAQGVPLLLVELIRGLTREGLVRRHPKGDSYYLATDQLDRVPELPLVAWLAHGEVDALPPALRSHAELLALLGDEVSPADVAGVLAKLEEQGCADEFPLDAAVGTRRLCMAGLLVQHKDDRITFRHALLREAVAKGIAEPLRHRIHLAVVAHFLDVREGVDDEKRLARLAINAASAGLVEVAERAFLDLAERMRARHAYLSAERWYSRALELPIVGDGFQRLGAYRGRGLMRSRLGRYHDALIDLESARKLAREKGDIAAQTEILLDEATALDWMDEFKSSEDRVRQAEALIEQVDAPLLEVRLRLSVGRSLHRFSREQEAASLLERTAKEAETFGNDGYESLVIAQILLGFIYQGLNRIDDARTVLDRTIALCQEHGDDLHLAAALNNRALLRAITGDREGTVADMEQGLALARKLGQAPLELIPQYNLGEYLYLADQIDEAEPHVRRALEIDRRLRGDAGRPVVALLEARCRLYRGEEAAARAIVERIRAQQEKARSLGHTDMLMVPSEEVLCAAVDLATRDGTDAEWDALEDQSARCSVGQEQIEVLEMRAIAALRRGRAVEAVVQLQRAIALSARIPNALGTRLGRRLEEAREAFFG